MATSLSENRQMDFRNLALLAQDVDLTGELSAASLDVNSIETGTIETGTMVGGVDTLTGAGAVSLNTLVTKIVTTDANALTLADGSEGQVKIIVMTTDGGDGTLTPANFANGSTITFGDVNDAVVLVFLGTEWYLLANNGATIA